MVEAVLVSQYEFAERLGASLEALGDEAAFVGIHGIRQLDGGTRKRVPGSFAIPVPRTVAEKPVRDDGYAARVGRREGGISVLTGCSPCENGGEWGDCEGYSGDFVPR